jgi:hypothetical protein
MNNNKDGEIGKSLAPIFTQTIRSLCAEADKIDIDRDEFIDLFAEIFSFSVTITTFKDFERENNESKNK